MPEPTVTKTCSQCKETKPFTEFYKRDTAKDGYRKQCKDCCRKTVRSYAESEEGKIARARYENSTKGKATRYRYTQTPYAIQQTRMYQKTNKFKLVIQRYHEKHPDRYEARKAANHAVESGQLPRIRTQTCSCGHQAQHYHHHKGYAEEHWLDVIPICIKCHTIISH